MLKRYSTPEMTKTFSEEKKFQRWLDTELAVLLARTHLGKLEISIYQRILGQAKFSVEEIERLDKEISHDLLAFVGTVQSYLDPELKKYFHAEGMTSYDTEEPATALIIIEAIDTIIEEIKILAAALKEKALKYKHLLKIGRTHGQHAEPTTLGLTFLFWYDSLVRQIRSLEEAREGMTYSKLSGAVGTYAGGLSPELEKQALHFLKLKSAPISFQIILRDRHLKVMNALEVLAGVLENMAVNIRLSGQTEIRELQEPFGKKQKGSSVMPHKKNTILTENLCGLATLIKCYALAISIHVPTWQERDISHSSVERVAVADAFQLTHFMLKRLTKVISGIVVNEKQIEKNLKLTRGITFSPEVKELLMSEGLDPETAYRTAQGLAFKAIEEDTPYLDLLLFSSEVPESLKKGLEGVFDYNKTVKFLDHVYERVLGEEA